MSTQCQKNITYAQFLTKYLQETPFYQWLQSIPPHYISRDLLIGIAEIFLPKQMASSYIHHANRDEIILFLERNKEHIWDKIKEMGDICLTNGSHVVTLTSNSIPPYESNPQKPIHQFEFIYPGKNKRGPYVNPSDLPQMPVEDDISIDDIFPSTFDIDVFDFDL